MSPAGRWRAAAAKFGLRPARSCVRECRSVLPMLLPRGVDTAPARERGPSRVGETLIRQLKGFRNR
jgi:hypothetical protein